MVRIGLKDGMLTTASKSYKLLSTIMTRAVKDKHLTDNPCDISGAQSLSTGKVVAWPTPDELKLLIANITPRYKLLLLLAADAGLGIGGLQSDFDLVCPRCPTNNPCPVGVCLDTWMPKTPLGVGRLG
jgi:hypothetical protein